MTEAQCFALSATKSKTFFIIKKDVELGISRAICTSSALQSFINLNAESEQIFHLQVKEIMMAFSVALGPRRALQALL